MVVEVKTKSGIEKYNYFDEDIDTVMVYSNHENKLKDGFEVTKRYNLVTSETHNCILVKKQDVVACYNDWVEEHFYFGDMRCYCERKNDMIRVMVDDKPNQYADEFTFEEYEIDDSQYPRKFSRYYVDVAEDDVRLKHEVLHKHKDYKMDTCGIYDGMSEGKRIMTIVHYLQEKIGKGKLKFYQNFSDVLLGCYGFRIPDKFLSTNIDLVFDEVIPNAYKMYKQGGKYAGKNFCTDLRQSIVNGYCNLNIKDKIFVEDGKKINAGSDYLFYMNLRFHLKLKDLCMLGIKPYTDLDLSNISYWLDRRCNEYLNNHEKVVWNDKIVCDDIGEYTKWAANELAYFRSFAK